MTSEIQKAIDSLQINDVFVQSSHSSITDGFDPKFSNELEELKLKFMHIVSRSETLTLESEEDEPLCLFRVYIMVGTRWIVETEKSKTCSDSEHEYSNEDSDDIKASIEATFVAEYRFTEEPGKEALEAFALKNASYHVWPYWREYLMQQTMRMNLQKVALPIVQFADNQK